MTTKAMMADSPTGLARSYAYCERLARREAGNFYPAFRLLPNAQRKAMCALYAFLRIADDIGDGPGNAGEKARDLDAWQHSLTDALHGNYTHRLHPALHHAVAVYGIDPTHLIAVIDGIRMDLTSAVYGTFAELYRYCYHVASAVGLCCMPIWECHDPRASVLAENAGIAFQLTNILRDLGEDAARQRIYLPREDLDRFGYSPDALLHGERTDAFRALMRFEVERAQTYYDAALPLAELLAPGAQAVFLMMLRTYRRLLDEMVRRDYDVFSERIRVSRWGKFGILLRTLPVRWGLA